MQKNSSYLLNKNLFPSKFKNTALRLILLGIFGISKTSRPATLFRILPPSPVFNNAGTTTPFKTSSAQTWHATLMVLVTQNSFHAQVPINISFATRGLNKRRWEGYFYSSGSPGRSWSRRPGWLLLKRRLVATESGGLCSLCNPT